MNKELFPPKTGTLGALISTAILSGMTACFFLALPAMWLTTLGKVFAIIWGAVTAAAVLAHIHTINQKRREIRLKRSLERLSREMHAKRRHDKKRLYARS